MRNLLLLLLLLPLGLWAQQFELTMNGFVDAENPEKDYIVIPFEGKTQKEIFDSALGSIGKVVTLVNNGINYIEYSQISITGVLPQVTYRGDLKRWYFNMNFNMTLEFKDGKCKINAPRINDIRQEALLGDVLIFLKSSETRGSFSDIALFNKKGKVISSAKKHKVNIEAATNKFLSSIINSMNEGKTEEW